MRMNLSLRAAWLILLAACASTPASLPEGGEPEIVSWEDGCQDDTTLELVCSEDTCAFFRCLDLVTASEEDSGTVELARWNRVPGFGRGRLRRGRYPGLDAEPVFLIRWHDHPAPLPRTQRPLPSSLFVRHHIFPQAPDLAAWFRRQRVDIHQYTLLIPRDVHLQLHSGGPRGGQWNEAWRQFTSSRETATHEEIWGQAIKLIVKFDLTGSSMVPYRRAP